MRAWRLHEPGSIGGLRLDEIDEPTAGDDDVIVRVEAIGLNSSELQVITGYWEGVDVHAERTLPFVVGREAAGTVVAVGRAVEQTAVGDAVLVHHYWPCGACEDCLSGWDNTCPHRLHVGRNVPGSYAELVRVPARFAIPLPEGVSCQTAVALSVAAGTAWHMLVVRGRLQAAETVLVLGGASGIGTAGVQVARLAGAHVIATAGHEWKLERLRELGAEHVLDHTDASLLAARVRELTEGKGVDLVFDAIGGRPFAAGLAALRRRGRLIVGGYMAGDEVPIWLPGMTATEATIIGSGGWTLVTTRLVLELARRGELRPIVDSVFPFAELPAALDQLSRREIFGKVVVTP